MPSRNLFYDHPIERKIEPCIICMALIIFLINKCTDLLPGTFSAYHLNDLIAGIVIVSWSNLVISFSNYAFRFNTIIRIILLEFISCFSWEIVAPILLPNSTRDIIDCACYMCGGLIYFLLRKLLISTNIL